MPILTKIILVACTVLLFADPSFASSRIEIDTVDTAAECTKLCRGQGFCTYAIYCPSRDPRSGPRCILTDQRPKFFTKKCTAFDKRQNRTLTAADYTRPPTPQQPATPVNLPDLGGAPIIVQPYLGKAKCDPARSWKQPIFVGIGPPSATCPKGYIQRSAMKTDAGVRFRLCAYCGGNYHTSLKYGRCCVPLNQPRP